MFSGDTACSSAQMTIVSAVTQATRHTIVFSAYTAAASGILEVECTNYRNPTYAQAIGPFTISLLDRDAPNHNIVTYPAWSMTVSSLTSVTLPGQVGFEFYENNSDTATINPIPIQTSVGLSILFDMDFVPIDNTGCYVKYQYPNDV